VDVVELVGLILLIVPNDYQFWAGDLNSSGEINVIDVVSLVGLVIGSELVKGSPLNRALLHNTHNRVEIEFDGNIAGLQLGVYGDFEITDQNLPSGWQIHSNSGEILLFSADGTLLTDQYLFSYVGDLAIKSVVATDWYGNSIRTEPINTTTEFRLSSAYPNPFNPLTTFYYDLPDDARVSIIVYDMQGRLVANLVNNDIVAGTHSVRWNASGLASGVYVVTMKCGNYRQDRKVLLMK